MITETAIKSAIAAAPKKQKAVELKDKGERGAGRLVLVVRPFDGRVSAEWYAYSYRGGRRASAKIGNYPTLPLASARKEFREKFAPTISSGKNLVGIRARSAEPKDASFAALVADYLDHLKDRASHRAASYALNAAVKHFGKGRAASAISTGEFVEYLGTIHGRGSDVSADTSRSYLHAAFQRAIKAENDYTQRGKVKSWGLTFNPITNIPVDQGARRAGKRHLSPAEWVRFFQWLETKDETWVVAPAVRLNMLTGQRVVEILRLLEPNHDREEQVLEWEVTKNTKPHSVPLPRQAVSIMGMLVPDTAGRFFPQSKGDAKQVSYSSVQKLIAEFLESNPDIKHFCARDIRRTWKTLTGAAGITKEMRDRLQNHAQGDVGSKHYDRYEYLPEKRAAMAVWSDYVDGMFAKAAATARD